MTNLFEQVDVQDQENAPVELSALVGPDKKYKTEADLVKAVYEKDRFITQLQSETAGLRQEVQKQTTMEELLTQVRSSLNPPAPPPSQPQAPSQDQTPNVESIVSSLLEQKEKERKIQNNKQLVEQKLLEKFGADAQLHLNKKAKELSVPLEYLAKVANEAPSAFFQLIGLQDNTPAQPFSAPRSTQSAPHQDASGKRDKKYYDNLKNTMKASDYWSPKIQNQLMKDALALGDAFYA